MLAGRVDAKVTAIDVEVAGVHAKAVGNGRAILARESKLEGRLATVGARLAARLEDVDAKLVGRVEALSSQVKANRDAIRDLGARSQATETAVNGLDVRLESVEKALAAITRAVDAKIG